MMKKLLIRDLLNMPLNMYMLVEWLSVKEAF